MANEIGGYGSERMQGQNEGSVEFDDSAQVGSVESRLAAARTLAEDLNSTNESRYEHQITVDGSVWRVLVEKL